MSRIHISVGTQAWTFDPDRVVKIGRGRDMDVTLDDSRVSRSHASLRFGPQGWELIDAGGANGTWINGARFNQALLGPSTEVRFGAPDGAPAVITVETPTATPQSGSGPVDLESTVIYTDEPADATGHGLMIKSNAGDRRFPRGMAVRIGRDPRSELVINDPVVSRLHATVEPRPDGWWFVNRAQGGSYIDGEPVAERMITDPTEISLGHPNAGYEIEVVPIMAANAARRSIAGKASKARRSKRVKVALALVSVAVVVAGTITAAVLLTQEDAKPTVDYAALLDRAKNATVQIIAVDEQGGGLYTGSGSIISSDGLILTNAHVADPNAPGQVPPQDDPPGFLIALPKADDTPAEPKFRAETLVSDGYVDVAVMKITSRIDGSPLQPGDIPTPIPVGDSKKLRTGDAITALGYPGLTEDDPSTPGSPLTVTTGVVSSFKEDPVSQTPRFFIDSDVRIGSGNSGGPSINAAGEIIGLNTAGITEAIAQGTRGSFTGGSALIVPVEQAAEVIRIGRAGGDKNYVSPIWKRLPQMTVERVKVVASGWSRDGTSGCDGTSSLTGVKQGDTIYAEFSVTGAPNQTPMAMELVDGDTQSSIDEGRGLWPYGIETSCFVIEIVASTDAKNLVAILAFGNEGEVSAENPVSLR